MNVKIKFTEQSQTVAELKQEISRLETKVQCVLLLVCRIGFYFNVSFPFISIEFRNVGRR